MQTERQIQIIDVSMELIADKGIQGFTIKNLSHAIGISEPAIYRHFKSKTDILLTVLNNFKEMGEMMSMIVSNDDTAIQKIEFMFSKMLEIFTEQPSIISIIFSEEIFKNETVLKTTIIDILNIHQNNIESIIEKGQLDNNVRKDIDKSSFALIFMGSLRLLVKRWDLNDHNFNLEKEGEKLIDSFKLLVI
ncbi:MAG: TetR/AcrR family transcriptional regulator [Bacteroidales bacterium]|nr:TetR/AcrR family transcriptional regulator [Bacteroidales bacterium]